MSRSRDVSDSNISGASGFDAGTVGYAMLIYLPLWDFLIVPYFVVKLLLDAFLGLARLSVIHYSLDGSI
jgi:hypothetical protein